MDINEITVKDILYLLIGKGFSKCEVWEKSDYIKVYKKKNLKQHLIASAIQNTNDNQWALRNEIMGNIQLFLEPIKQ